MLRLVTALAVACSLSAVSAGNCDIDYQCEYHYQTATDLWYWNLNPLCSNSHYTALEAGRPGSNFTFNICGLSDQICAPADLNKFIPWQGVAVQNSGASCALAGEGAPIFTPTITSNPATGGLNVTHHAAPAEYNGNECAEQPNGVVPKRRITYMIGCDKLVDSVAVDYATEKEECNYVISMRSKYGCGVIYDGPDSKAAADKEAAERAAEAGSVIGFMILGSLLFVGGWAGIHYYQHQELPFSIPYVGNMARGPSAPAGGGFGTTGSGFGASGATGSYGQVGGSS